MSRPGGVLGLDLLGRFLLGAGHASSSAGSALLSDRAAILLVCSDSSPALRAGDAAAVLLVCADSSPALRAGDAAGALLRLDDRTG